MQANTKTLPRLENGEIRYPRGWFIIGGSDEYPQGEAKGVKYFNQELVVFRGEDNTITVLDAYCPHLGAHLGHGGQVVGNTIQCPFHAWRFDASGECVEVPYAKRIPPKGACTRSWHTMEKMGLVFIWHDPRGGDPEYDIPDLPEYGQEGWTGWNLKRLTIDTHPREVIENVADVAHFGTVHKIGEIDEFDNIYEDHKATQIMKGRGAGGELDSRATYFGPAFQITWMRTIVESRLVNTNTPIDENTIHLWFGVMIQASNFTEEDLALINASLETVGMGGAFDLTPDNMGMIQEAIIAATQQGYYEDVAIWEHKLFREDPILCDGDGPLNKLRKWYSQFYTDTV